MSARAGDGNGGERVEDVVASEDEFAEPGPVGGTEVGIGRETEGDEADAGADGLVRKVEGLGVVGTDDHGARRVAEDRAVAVEIGLLGGEVFKVVEIDGIEDEDVGTVEGKRAVRFVGFDDEEGGGGRLLRSGDGHRPRLAADAPGGRVAEGGEELRREGRGRRLAVRPADGDATGGVHAVGEDGATGADGKATRARLGAFRCRGRHGGGHDQLVDLGKMRGSVPLRHGDPARLQPARTGRRGYVAPRDGVPGPFQQKGETGHADPANAHEMETLLHRRMGVPRVTN